MTEKDKRLIDKLLRMSMSSNRNEAAVAAEKLAEVLARNGMSRADAETMGHRNSFAWMRTKYKDIPKWHHMLTGNLGVISGVYVVKSADSYLLSGQPEDIENFIYIIEFVSGELERMAARYRQKMPVPRHHTQAAKRSAVRKRMDAYRQGVVIGVCMNLREAVSSFFSSPTSRKDLVPVDDRYETAKKKAMEQFGGIQQEEYALSDEKRYINDGVHAGTNIKIRKGVSGGRDSRSLTDGGCGL